MSKVFEVGKEYEPNDTGFSAIRVLRRTDKTVWVENDCSKWSMRIKRDDKGNEYASDSSVPRRWRHTITYQAKYEIK